MEKEKIPNYVFTVHAYEERVQQQMMDATIITIFASNEAEAIKKSQMLIKKKSYYVAAINEVNYLATESLELQKRQIKNMERLNGTQKRPWEKDDED